MFCKKFCLMTAIGLTLSLVIMVSITGIPARCINAMLSPPPLNGRIL
jgi:hypothetical protein